MIVEELWFSQSAPARALRVAATPLSVLFGAAVAARRMAYDRRWLPAWTAPVPVASVGNLTVGGTGKTPFAAWLTSRLSRAAMPGVVLRGYGADEVLVHAALNPLIPVHTGADRAAAIRRATGGGADVIVLDDAHQHRRVTPTVRIVLVSAEQLLRPVHLLPAGPWREPLSGAQRADLLVLTRKAADDASVTRARSLLSKHAGDVPIVTVRLEQRDLVSSDGGAQMDLGALRGREVFAIAAVGEPELFASQLRERGARVTLRAFRDHHVFTAADATELARSAGRTALAVCTLKDAVKLRGWWPGPDRLWYVSQHLVVEHGEPELERVVERLLAARPTIATRAD